MAKNQNNNVAPATQKTEPGAKKDALATALAQIEKQFGKGAIMKLGDNTAMQVDAISTGSLGLDLRREPLLLGRDLFVIVRRNLRRLFLGLAADGGGFRFGVRENAGGDLFNSVHRFALLYRVTC